MASLDYNRVLAPCQHANLSTYRSKLIAILKPIKVLRSRHSSLQTLVTFDSNSTASQETSKEKPKSSWDAKEAGSVSSDEKDYLYSLGKSDINLNIDTGQNSQMIDSIFTGTFLGHKSDIADGTLRRYEFRTFNNIVGDYYIGPRYLEKVAMHMAKNYMVDLGVLPKSTMVPLILGIWGEKGMGKTFQLELSFRKLGVEAVVMSAGELEHEWAGTPARLIRERYRRAAEMSKVRGKMTALVINDIDAGLGHFANTQVTVNNQVVVGALMNICDNPNSVPIIDEWKEEDEIRRTPIIVTGNDFTNMFAPLVRDGRMDKFYWKPEREDLIMILFQMYKDDGVSIEDIDRLLNRFPKQPLDFFGALRASTYDNQIRDWIVSNVTDGKAITDETANMAALSKRLLKKDNLPVFEPVELTLEMLIKEGERLEQEQEHVNRNKLSMEYMKGMKNKGKKIIGLQG